MTKKEELELLLKKYEYYYIDVKYSGMTYESIIHKKENDIYVVYIDSYSGYSHNGYDYPIDSYSEGYYRYIYDNLDKLVPIHSVIIKNAKNFIIKILKEEKGSIQFLDTKLKLSLDKNNIKLTVYNDNNTSYTSHYCNNMVALYKMYLEIRKQNFL